MMSKTMIDLLFTLGVSTWIYNKAMHSTGNNTQNSLIMAGASGLVIFLLAFFVLGAILH